MNTTTNPVPQDLHAAAIAALRALCAVAPINWNDPYDHKQMMAWEEAASVLTAAGYPDALRDGEDEPEDELTHVGGDPVYPHISETDGF
jgi:hypothetical protein